MAHSGPWLRSRRGKDVRPWRYHSMVWSREEVMGQYGSLSSSPSISLSLSLSHIYRSLPLREIKMWVIYFYKEKCYDSFVPHGYITLSHRFPFGVNQCIDIIIWNLRVCTHHRMPFYWSEGTHSQLPNNRSITPLAHTHTHTYIYIYIYFFKK